MVRLSPSLLLAFWFCLVSVLAATPAGCAKSGSETGAAQVGPSKSAASKPGSRKIPAKPRREGGATDSDAADAARAAEDRDKKAAVKEPPQRVKEAPQRVVRPSVKVPQHDDRRLAGMGIHRYESRHLVLYTDIDPELARPLPSLMDQAYAAWVDYFGPLPPDRERSDFQMIAENHRGRSRGAERSREARGKKQGAHAPRSPRSPKSAL